jgi:hypothetical protein
MKRKKGESSLVADELEELYKETPFDQTILSPTLLKELLFEGWADQAKIRAALDKSPYYATPGSEPAWQIAWRGFEVRDAEYEAAVATVEEQFKKINFVIRGEVLHVFGLRLMFSDVGVISQSRSEVVRECKEYVDKLRQLRRFPEALTENSGLSRTESWEGLGFYERETNEFQEIARYYDEAAAASVVDRLPEAGRALLDLLKANPDAYFRKLCVNNVEASLYYNIPVLAAIPVEDFVAVVGDLEPSAQRIAFTTFRGRYDHGLLKTDLKAEEPWLRAVKRRFEEIAAKSRAMSKFRILSWIGRNVDPFLVIQDEGLQTGSGKIDGGLT